MQSRPSLKKINGADISDDVTDEVWEQEFHEIDINKNGYISFGEFCKYVTKFIVTPKQFIEDILNEKHDMFEEEAGNAADSAEVPIADASPAVEEDGATTCPLPQNDAFSTPAEAVITDADNSDVPEMAENVEPTHDVVAVTDSA